MVSEAEVWNLLLDWRSDIASVPLPELVDTDTALAVLAACVQPGKKLAT